MKKIIFFILLVPSFLFSQWIELTAPSNLSMISSIDFCDTNTGVACSYSDHEAAYTTNSGANWFSAQIPDSTRGLFKVQFINDHTGYMAGSYNISKKYGNQEYYGGLFLKSTDAGKTWFTYGNVPSDVFCLLGMKFINENTGYASALMNLYFSINAILKTTDGGMNWIYLISDSARINNIYTYDGNIVFAAGRHYGSNDKPMILRSTDGGASWSAQFFTVMSVISDIYFPNPSTGFAVSEFGSDIPGGSFIYKTTNSGVNWIKLGFQNTRTAYESVEFIPGTGKGIAVGWRVTYPQGGTDGLIICRTTDYGLNWSNYFIPDTINHFYCCSIADSNVWFTAGGYFNAVIFKTTNGGGPIGIKSISSEIPERFSLYQNHPNPFNPATRIKFDIPPSKGARGMTRLVIYDVLGKEVAILVNENLKPGSYEAEWDGTNYPSEVYFYKLETDNFSVTKKMVLIK
jgi:photosystem II stability/assembly factor-like uncharacterized protein